MDFFSFINNASLLLILSLLGTNMQFRWVKKEPLRGVLLGILYGTFAAIAMSIPMVLEPGVFFDGRSVILSLAGFFTSGLTTAIASLIAIAFRVHLGGSGVFTGVGSILISASLGTLFRKLVEARKIRINLGWFFVLGFVVHLLLVVWFFTLPASAALKVIQNVALPYLLVFPLATMLIGGFMQDQLQRIRMETELADSEKRYRELVDTLNEGVWAIDDQSRTIFVNPKMAEMLGYSVEEMMGKPLEGFIRERDIPILEFYRERRRQGHRDQYEITYLKKDGKSMIALMGVTPNFNEKGEFIGALAGVQDITILKETQAKLEKQSRHLENTVEERTRELKAAQVDLINAENMATLGKLAGSVGHELRNPLAVISNSVYLLKMALSGEEATVKEYLGMIEKETQNASLIITDLLNYSRIKTTPSETIDLAEMMRDFLIKYPQPQSIQVVNEIAADLPAVRVNPQQLEQILLNLVTNAAEAMPEGGTLKLATRVSKDKLVLTVSDSGVGIPKENLKKIFEPLFTTKPRGIGLGLAITSRLAELNHITIRVKSKTGQGTTFSLEFLIPA